jgi:hypothetical protein
MKSYLLVLLLALPPLILSLLANETVDSAPAAKSEPTTASAPAHPVATPVNQSGSTKSETRNSK